MGEKIDGKVIEDPFGTLKRRVGPAFKMLNDMIYHEMADECPEVFTDLVQNMSEDSLFWFNEAMKDISEEFEGLEYKPITLDRSGRG